MKKLNEKDSSLEESIEKMIVKKLPTVMLSEEEIKEIKGSIEQIKKGEYVSLEELVNA